MYHCSVAFAVAALVSSAAGIADYQKLPQCARPAFLRAAGRSPCTLIDTACICATPELATAVKDVLPHACPGEDFAKAYELACELCPNLKTLFPSASNPILRIHPTAATDLEYRIQEDGHMHGGQGAASQPTGRQTANATSYFSEAIWTAAKDAPAPTPRAEHHAQANEDTHDGEPAPYTTPANFAASVSATLAASDFGNTETWKFPTTPAATSIPKNNTTRTGTVSVPEATGEASGLGGSDVAAAVAVAVIGIVFFGL